MPGIRRASRRAQLGEVRGHEHQIVHDGQRRLIHIDRRSAQGDEIFVDGEVGSGGQLQRGVLRELDVAGGARGPMRTAGQQ